MRLLNNYLMLTAAMAAVSLISCQKQELKPVKDGMTITLNANVEEFGNVSKSHIEENDGIYNIIWDEGETMRTWVYNETAASSSETTGFTTDENGNGLFTVHVPNPAEGTNWTSIAGIYPSSAVESSTNAEQVRVNLSNIQSPSNNSYAPGAYILLARPTDLTVEDGGQLNTSFYRATALNKFTITNLEHGGDIVSAKITFPEGKQAAGYKRFNLKTTAPLDYTSTQNYIELRYASPLAAGTNGEYVLWFTTWEVNIAPEETVTVEITTEDYKYTKNFTGNTASFKESFLNFLSIDMTGATAEELAPAGDYSGNYLIVGQKSSTWYYMLNTAGSNFIQAQESSVSKDITDLTCADFYSEVNIENFVWTVTKKTDGYSICNNGQYLNLSNDSATLGDEISLYIVKEDDGTYTIRQNTTSDYKLQFNASSPRFKPYKPSSNQQNIYLISWIPNTSPLISVAEPIKNVSSSATTVEFNYTTSNITGDLTLDIISDEYKIIVSSEDDHNGTISITLNPNSEEISKSATLSLSYPGAESVALTINQEAYIANGIKYVLVEDENAFVNGGKYLFAFKDGQDGSYYFIPVANGKNPKLTKNALTVDNMNTVTFASNEEEATYSFEAVGSEDGFKFQNQAGTFISYSSSSAFTASESGTKFIPTFLPESKCYKIDDGSRYLSYYTTPDVRAYAVKSFIDQISEGIALKQYCGAISVFKLVE